MSISDKAFAWVSWCPGHCSQCIEQNNKAATHQPNPKGVEDSGFLSYISIPQGLSRAIPTPFLSTPDWSQVDDSSHSFLSHSVGGTCSSQWKWKPGEAIGIEKIEQWPSPFLMP